MTELLGLSAKAPSDRLAGYQLGQPGGEPTQIVIPGWWVTARAVTRDGVVAHVIVELAPDETGSDGGALAAIELEIRKAWGTSHKGWRGSAAQLFVGEYGGFLRGTSSLVINLLPLGDDYVCGSRDGFTAFFRTFKQALVAKDASSLERMIVSEPNNDMQTCVDGTGKPDIACIAKVSKRLPPKAACNLSQEVYFWRTIEAMHGGSYFVFRRNDGVWTAQGPIGIGHDDDPDSSSP